MKQHSMVVILILVLCGPVLGQTNSTEILLRLKSFSVADLEKDKEAKEGDPLQIDKIYRALRDGTNIVLNQKVDTSFVVVLLSVLDLALQHDLYLVNEYATNIVLPAFKRKELLLRKAAQELGDKKKEKRVLEYLEALRDQEIKGNG